MRNDLRIFWKVVLFFHSLKRNCLLFKQQQQAVSFARIWNLSCISLLRLTCFFIQLKCYTSEWGTLGKFVKRFLVISPALEKSGVRVSCYRLNKWKQALKGIINCHLFQQSNIKRITGRCISSLTNERSDIRVEELKFLLVKLSTRYPKYEKLFFDLDELQNKNYRMMYITQDIT